MQVTLVLRHLRERFAKCIPRAGMHVCDNLRNLLSTRYRNNRSAMQESDFPKLARFSNRALWRGRHRILYAADFLLIAFVGRGFLIREYRRGQFDVLLLFGG